jgi:integrase
MRRKLTATSVRQLKAPEIGQIQYNDSELPGFALRVTANDVRSFVLQYRPRSGPHKGRWTRWTVGRLASSPKVANGLDLLTLGQAREIARHARVAIRDQRADPARDGKRVEGDDGPETYAKAVEKYIETYQIKKKGNRTAGEVKRLLLREGAGWLDSPVNEITRSDIHNLLDRLMADGKHYLANRAFAALRTFFKWCVSRDKIEHSPCEGVERPFDGERPRERHYDDDEIRAIWKAADALEGPRGAFLKVMLLTGKRRGEVAGLTWDELDLDNGIWTLPASRTKGKRAHKMPLPGLAVRILKAQPRIEGNSLVFPGQRHGKPISGWSVFNRAVEKASGVSDFTFHACRHTLKTRLGELGVPAPRQGQDHAPRPTTFGWRGL